MDSPGVYRKGGLEVTALQWTGVNFPAVCDFADPDRIRVDVPGEQLSLWVDKAMAWATVLAGDWIVADRDGDGFCPYLAAEFDSYEAVG